ncbi:lytic murein transglycosylase B [Gilliamella sp. Pra-s65]|uniref:lytic murein transglycosylase B n=1 Tax=unclassified Gilliamella TaxID=2685620 RepID=UPI0013219BE8|nr:MULTISPECIES: lytic murein transglycosylase B [unclassified Gilliamella]MWN32756.1 lytic murein transglycosylase B [Gilliamella sp. Pra-s60]MWN89552.1 lytic murein transglycosylase B [Gilliamella sp. Pra-s65]MWP30210.1 lytic murein transglycosylase B [Gilliamella sp. Pra-s54]MWP47599.1 lytic murein transglycosylase B [Gilliamella sp. Pas-s27]MWP72560.1 lytic murein transglycosylase B [Gilliamella sp. Pra-s52]
MQRIIVFVSLILLLTACSNKRSPTSPMKEHRGHTNVKGGVYLEKDHNQEKNTSAPLAVDQEKFIDRMVSKHGFNRQQLRNVLAQANKLDWAINLMDKQAPKAGSSTVPNGAWIRYKNKFITASNLPRGVEFWNQYQKELQRAYNEYGVPPEIIVGIIGVETGWGRVMGKTKIIDALSTLAFYYPRRAQYFSNELEDFLVMCRDEGVDPFDLSGSFAGAMGYGQFMPSAFRRHAVDFNHDGHIDLWDPVDAIGSVANYFKSHGWQRGKKVAVIADGQAPSLNTGFSTKYSIEELAKSGLKPRSSLDGHTQVSLLRLDVGDSYQFWYGLPNFYTITRYNHSTHYAMAVWQLGLAVKDAR